MGYPDHANQRKPRPEASQLQKPNEEEPLKQSLAEAETCTVAGRPVETVWIGSAKSKDEYPP